MLLCYDQEGGSTDHCDQHGIRGLPMHTVPTQCTHGAKLAFSFTISASFQILFVLPVFGNVSDALNPFLLVQRIFFFQLWCNSCYDLHSVHYPSRQT